MKRILLVGNWKMHLNTQDSSILMHRLHERIPIYRHVEVVIAPSMLTLQPLSVALDRRKFRLAAQNAHFLDDGAVTGEVSFTMLRGLVHYALVGHSERRHQFGEDEKIIQKKVTSSVRNGIIPIICVGETASEKENNETLIVVHDQVVSALHGLTHEEVSRVVIAYEPVWAISSGKNFSSHKTPTPEEVERVAEHIIHTINELYGKEASSATRILYGGSSNAQNAYSYLSAPHISGLLTGGASLNYWQFSRMANICARVAHEKNIE